MDFNNKLDKFRLEPPSDNWSFKNACEEFHEELIKAKTMDVIIEKRSNQELSECKEQVTNLQNQLNGANSKIEMLLEEKGFLKGKLEMYERDLPKSNTLTGDVSD